MLIPLLIYYPVLGVLVVAVGLYFSSYLTVNLGKGLVGALLTAGITLISAAGTVGSALSVTVIQALVIGIVLAIVCHWVVYPWLPEDTVPAQAPKPPKQGAQSSWIALRATLIVLPAYLLTLTNPSMYLPIIMKSVSLSHQGSLVSVHDAGRELLGSTFLAGCFAMLFWLVLKICPSLWMFFWWMLLFGVYFSSKLYKLIPSRFPGSFWQNTVVTMLILLGTAVQDTANGKDVYTAFAVRMGLFVAVTLYAWLAVYALEMLRTSRLRRSPQPVSHTEQHAC